MNETPTWWKVALFSALVFGFSTVLRGLNPAVFGYWAIVGAVVGAATARSPYSAETNRRRFLWWSSLFGLPSVYAGEFLREAVAQDLGQQGLAARSVPRLLSLLPWAAGFVCAFRAVRSDAVRTRFPTLADREAALDELLGEGDALGSGTTGPTRSDEGWWGVSLWSGLVTTLLLTDWHEGALTLESAAYWAAVGLATGMGFVWGLR